MRLTSNGPAETEAAGAWLVARLFGGDVAVLSGELGSGKTTFVRGACRALGIEGPITSPTFNVGHLYAAPNGLEVAHLDLYRLASLEGPDEEILGDYLTDARIGFVEWPGAAAGRLERVAARVSFEHAGGDRRTIEIV